MAWLESLAQGMRGAGGILDANVYQEGLRDERLKEVEISRRRDLIAQQVIQGASDGRIPPEAAQQTLQKLGYGDLPVGLSLGAQQQQQAMKDKLEHAELLRIAPEIMASGDPAKIQALMLKLAPQQFVANMTKEASGGAQPDIYRLHIAERRLRAAGDNVGADRVLAVINNKEHGGTSQGERGFQALQRFQNKVNSGQSLTPEEELEAQSARALLSQQRVVFDPVTQREVLSQPLTIPTSINVGMGGQPPRQGNAIPDQQQGGRRALDAGS